MAEKKITLDELNKMFDGRVPLIALKLLAGAPEGTSTDQIREELQRISTELKEGVTSKIRSSVGEIDAWLLNMGVVIGVDPEKGKASPLTGPQKTLMRARNALESAMGYGNYERRAHDLIREYDRAMAAHAASQGDIKLSIMANYGELAIALLRRLYAKEDG